MNKYVLLTLGILVLICVSASLAQIDSKTDGEKPSTVKLAPPLFLTAKAQTTGAAFPENEAGISAYLRPVTSIDLSQAKSVFATIDEEAEDYIKGTVSVAGMTEDEYPYVWVSSDGWIVAYIPRDYKSEALIAPFGYNYPTTTLAEAIKKVCNAIGADFDYNQVGYYHFKFPDANGMVVVSETCENWPEVDEFYIYVPEDFTIYNVSWAYHSTDDRNWARIDGQTFVSGYANPHKKVGYLEQFEKGINHKIEVSRSSGGVKLGLVIIYKQP